MCVFSTPKPAAVPATPQIPAEPAPAPEAGAAEVTTQKDNDRRRRAIAADKTILTGGQGLAAQTPRTSAGLVV